MCRLKCPLSLQNIAGIVGQTVEQVDGDWVGSVQ